MLKKQLTVDDTTSDYNNRTDGKEKKKLNHSFSEPLDGEMLEEVLSDVDMDFSVRRMAICAKLGVPATSQLKTYVVLNRLQQYGVF